MGRSAVYPGLLTLAAGLAALALSAGFLWLNRGLRPGGVLGEMPSFPEDLAGPLAIAVLFQYATPFLCGLAFLMGFHARTLWTARAGILAAALAAMTYLAYLRGWVDVLAGGI